MEVTIGELIDKKYRIVRLLGEGGMGAVYEGENVRIHHRVAIKVLHAGIANNGAAVERFEREAQAAGKIGSDHIVEVFDLGELPSGARYMVMEYLDGENLSSRIRSSGRMAAHEIAPLMLQMLEGLGAAHHAGIVHRDLKPDNVFLVRNKKTPGDFVKIVDFGVSKFNNLSGDSAMSMTRTGAVIGTPYYMSPEQARGAKTTDHRSDLYSAGVVLYECATGQVPFLADTFNELMFKIVLEPPPDPTKIVAGLDPRFAAIIMKAMAREVDARFQSAQEFAQAVHEWMSSLGMTTGISRPSFASGGNFANLTPAMPTHAHQLPVMHVVTPSPDMQTSAAAGPPMVVAGKLSKTAGSIPNVAAPIRAQGDPPRGSSGVAAGIAVAAVVLLAGGGFAALKVMQGRGAPPPAAAGPSVGVVSEPPATTPPAPPPVVTAVAVATATDAPAAPSASASAAAVASAAAAPTSTSQSRREREKEAAALAALRAGKDPKAAPSASAPAAATTAAPNPETDLVKGRTIRTGL